MNISYVKSQISTFIYQKTGTHIDDSQLSIKIFPQPYLQIKKLNINITDEMAVEIKTLKLKFDGQAILYGKININSITVDYPEIKTKSLRQAKSILPMELSIPEYFGNLRQIFDFLPLQRDNIEIRFKNFSSAFFKDMDGYLSISKKDDIVFRSTINGIKIDPYNIFPPYFDQYFNLSLIEFGQIETNIKLNLKNEIQGRCKFIGTKIRSQDHKIILDTDPINSSFKISDKFYKIDTNSFKLGNSKKSLGSLSVHFLDDSTKKKSKLQFIGTEIHISRAKKSSLLFFKDSRTVRILFRILDGGMIPKIDVSFQSNELESLFKEEYLRIRGELKDGFVNIPKTDITASHVYGFAGVSNKILYINTNKAMIQSSKVEKGQLSIELSSGDTAPFKGEFFLDADLAMLPDTLISLLPDTVLAKELSKVHDVQGKAKAKLNLELPSDSHQLQVVVATKDFSVTGKYDRIPGMICLEHIKVKYEPDIIYLNGVTGFIDGNRLDNLNGAVNFVSPAWINIKSGSGRVKLSSIIPWLTLDDEKNPLVFPVKNGSGELYIDSINLSGPVLDPGQWQYIAKGDGAKIYITTDLGQKQMEDMAFNFKISENSLYMQNLKGEIKNFSWMQHLVDKKIIDSIFMPVSLEKACFYKDKTYCTFKGELNFTTGPRLQLDCQGDSPGALTLNNLIIFEKETSNASISNISISMPDSTSFPMFDFKGSLNTSTLNKILINDSYLSKEVNAFTRGYPILINMDKDNVLTVTTKQLDLNSLTCDPNDISLCNDLLKDGHLNFKADQLTAGELTFTDVNAKVLFAKEKLFIALENAFLCDMAVTGEISLNKDEIQAFFPFSVHNNPNIQNLLTCLYKKDNLIDGIYSLDGNISLSGKYPKKIFDNLNGSFKLTAEQGRIQKMTLLSRILSLLNVSKFLKGHIPDVIQNGFAYKEITIEADIKDRKIYLDNAIINGKDMLIILNGWIDPLNDKMDITCLIAPFKTIDTIIEKIPVLNTLLGGKLISVPFKANGKFSDPVVIPLHPSAVGKEIVNIMSNILKTPVKLLDKLSGENDEPGKRS